MAKKFVPCYKLVFTTFDFDGCVLQSLTFIVDYFKRDSKGRFYLDLIDDNFCIPFEYSRLDFYRIR